MGKVRKTSPPEDPAPQTFTTKVPVVNPSLKLSAAVKMGMTANIQCTLSTPRPFIKAPLTAPFQERDGTSVWVAEKGAVNLVPVHFVGMSGNDVLFDTTRRYSRRAGDSRCTGEPNLTAQTELNSATLTGISSKLKSLDVKERDAK